MMEPALLVWLGRPVRTAAGVVGVVEGIEGVSGRELLVRSGTTLSYHFPDTLQEDTTMTKQAKEPKPVKQSPHDAPTPTVPESTISIGDGLTQEQLDMLAAGGVVGDAVSNAELTALAQQAEAVVTGVRDEMPTAEEIEAEHRAGYLWPEGTLLGVYDTEAGTWCVLTTNAVFATEDARLARAQLQAVSKKFPHEPNRIEIRPLE